ncbi:uncharacterized protein LOC111046164 isoform X2 [Nilaparvata lugens]|uniref:uncharacterized protein LOC111046164 isoform X2 n=1 Tax=Nilaparvata lugens TaxID=108931 RepID=UPI00193D43FC|nr:uncharacterized protein LOC111046164 isoform X2 [Nilaparvata lugens]
MNMQGGVFQCSDGPPSEGTSEGNPQSRNPLICFVCDDYYSEPCLLSCYHTFCARCLRGRSVDNKISCPFCGHHTILKDGSAVPPSDLLMRQLIEIANAENPPCANCDKRDRASMYFCSTCGQALCTHCRENTHRAKMFSTHDIVHMSKCSKDVHRRCPVHGEQYIMFSNSQRNMLCVNCFRDTPTEARSHCVDIDTAYTQGTKKLDRAISNVQEAQNTVREGVMSYRSLLEELRRNTDTEKMTIHSFCQGMQEAINKTQSSMVLEVQRPMQSSQIRTNYRSEFAHSLEPWIGKLTASNPDARMFDGSSQGPQASQQQQQQQQPAPGQGTVTPLHPAPSRKQHSALKAKALEGEGPFSNHCRSFDTQIKEMGVQLGNVRERLCELQRDITLLRRAATPPLAKRHLTIAKDCERLDDTLQHYHVELDRLRSVFNTLWQEQLYRIHVEQDIFQTQMNDIVSLRSEVKQLAMAAQQLEPYVRSLSSQTNLDEMANLQTLIDRITTLQNQHYQAEQAAQKQGGFRSQMTSPTAVENGLHLKGEMPVREPSKIRATKEGTIMDGGGERGPSSGIYSRTPPGGSSAEGRSRGVISQLIEKVRTKEERKKSPVSEDVRSSSLMRERSKSEGRSKEMLLGDGSRPKLVTPSKSDGYRIMSGGGGGGGSGVGGGGGGGGGSGGGSKRSSLYHTISGKVLGTRESVCNDLAASLALDIPPPPPARRPASDTDAQQQILMDQRRKKQLQQAVTAQQREASAAVIGQQLREHLENHLKQKLKMKNREASRSKDSLHYQGGDEDECNYQHISEATSCVGVEGGGGGGSGSLMIRALVHPTPPSPPPHHRARPVYPHSDTEDSVFYSDTPSGRRRRSVDLMDRRKTLVVLINSGKSKSRMMQKQRSWETFPPKKRGGGNGSGGGGSGSGQDNGTKFCRDPDSFRGGFDLAGLKKADSFEGHEEAVRTLVAAVQETRTLRKPKSPAPSTPAD